MRWLHSFAYHGLVGVSIAAIVVGSIPFLKIIAVHAPGQGLQEAISN